MNGPLDDEEWPIELQVLISDPSFSRRVTAAARKKLGRVSQEEIFDGISAFVVRALEEEKRSKVSQSVEQKQPSYLSRFPSSFSVIRYIVVTIRNNRIRDKKRSMETTIDADIDLEGLHRDERCLLEDAVISYLAKLMSAEPSKIVHDPAGLDSTERKVIQARWEGHTQQEISDKIGKSVSTIHRIEKKALAKLRVWLIG
jgi:RNA polymerase sigma factor (sigma-70 family)